EADQAARPLQPPVPRHAGREAEHRRRAGDAAGEEVERDLRLPDRLLQDRAAVVRLEGRGVALRHRDPTASAKTPAISAPAATTAVRHMSGRSRVVTTGSGGSP